MTRTRKSLIGGALAVAGLITLGPLGAAPATTHAAALSSVVGTLQSGFATDGSTPLQLTVQGQSTPISVQVSSSTTVVRRYNGLSSLSELSPGDSIAVRGTMSGTSTIVANVVKDFSIQRAFTHNLGVITAASSGPNGTTTLKVRVLRDSVFKGQNPFAVGNTITMNVPSTLQVILADGTVTTFGSLSSTPSAGSTPTSFLDSVNNSPVGITIATLGVYDRQTLGFQSVWRMRVVTATPGSTTAINGVLQPGFTVGATSSTLTLQTPLHGTVTVNVDSNTLIVRRYNGISALAELSPNDRLAVVGKYLGNGAYSATIVKDFTIQRAFTFMVGRVDGVDATHSTLSVTVLANGRHHARDPFKIGQSITVNAAGATITLANGTTGAISNLASPMRIGVVGVYNRKAHSFTTVNRIRVLNS